MCVGFSEGYTFHGDVDRVFREFFGGNNPFAGIYNCTYTHDKSHDKITSMNIIIQISSIWKTMSMLMVMLHLEVSKDELDPNKTHPLKDN